MKNRLLSIIVALTLIVTAFTAVACRGEKESETTNTSDGVPSSSESVSDFAEYDDEAKVIVKDKYDGTHVFTATETDLPFITNGKCGYTVVIPATRGAVINRANGELLNFFAEATGITLAYASDDVYEDKGNGFISLGETTFFKNSGIVIDKAKLTEDGARIVTEGKNIYIIGGGDYGTLYGVYDFLEILFNFDVYYRDCYEIDKNVNDMKLRNFDVTDIPDLEFRSNGYYRLIKDDWAYRFRQPRTYGTLTFPIYEEVGNTSSKAATVHNSLVWLPMSQYAESHPDWYANSGAELCYTAHGNKDEYEEMQRTCVEKAIATLKLYNKEDNPDLRILNFTQQDNTILCDCAACSSNVDKYGANSASLILFMNDLRTKLDAAMADLDEKYRRDNLTLTFFAYQSTENAPSAAYPEMRLKDGVSVFLATSNTFDHQSSIYEDSNTAGRENLKNWGKISDEILLWTYSTKFSHYMYPVDTYNFYGKDAYEFFAANNVKLIYNQSQVTQNGTCTAWHNLKAYLDSKLEWDGTRNAKYYTDKYINAMFGKAAPEMKKIYESVRLRIGIVKTMYNGTTLLSGVTDLDDKNFWPYLTVKGWLDMYDKAYAALDEYKLSDPKAYEVYKAHVDAEFLSPAYIMLNLYSGDLSATESAQLKDRFRAAVKSTGITNISETGNNQIGSFLGSL